MSFCILVVLLELQLYETALPAIQSISVIAIHQVANVNNVCTQFSTLSEEKDMFTGMFIFEFVDDAL